MKAFEVIRAYGHENILATNKRTFEITKDTYVTRRGDCIIAIKADKSLKDLDIGFKRILRKENVKLTINIQADDEKELVEAFGDSHLTCTHSEDLVVRKSSYTCDRTLAIKSNKAAHNLSRDLVAKLRNSRQKINIKLIVEDNI
ncbi:MAG: DUF371 domain-containing protein [Candidatus Bathyarchaeota archaeon]|nr:MAG: DUF371 domain-containing protein [Candidatus Bathyarchaeota archaeon]